MAAIHANDLTKSISAILESSEYSDMTVCCGSEEFKLHRAIVCPRSKFFAAACAGQFQEAQTSTIVLREDDPPTVCRMLTYLYTLDYDDDGPLASAQHYIVNGMKVATFQALTATTMPLLNEKLSRHAKKMNNVVVYAIAQKYDIGELKVLATAKFRKSLWDEEPDHGLPDIIDAVFGTASRTTMELLKLVVQYCKFYITKILSDDHLCDIVSNRSGLGLFLLRELNANAIESYKEKELQQSKLVAWKKKLAPLKKEAAKLSKSLRPRDEASIGAFLKKLKTALSDAGI